MVIHVHVSLVFTFNYTKLSSKAQTQLHVLHKHSTMAIQHHQAHRMILKGGGGGGGGQCPHFDKNKNVAMGPMLPTTVYH